MQFAEQSNEQLAADAEEMARRIHSVIDTLDFADGATLLHEADLYEAGMSSHASVKLMLGIEDAFDIEFPDEMLERETFSSIAAISAAVTQILTHA